MSVRPLVFVSCGTTTAPLIPHLASRYTLVVPGADLVAQLKRQNVDAVSWEVLARPQRAGAVAAEAAERARAWGAKLEEMSSDLFRFAGRHREATFLPGVIATLRGRIADQLMVIEFGRSLAASGLLAAAVVHEDITAPVRAFLGAIRRFGVPSVHVPHGVYVKERVVGADVHGTAHADMLAVGGVVQRDWFIERGVSPSRIVVTGNPAWDPLCSLPRGAFPRPALPAGPVVTFAASWLGRETPASRFVMSQHRCWTEAVLAGVSEARKKRPELRLVVKQHPSATAEEQRRVLGAAAQLGVRVDAVMQGPAQPILAHSDVLVTLPSTIVIEAILLGTPVVVPELFYEGDAVLTVPAKAEAVAEALLRALGGWGRSEDFLRRRDEFASLYNGPADGGAAARVAALVDELGTRARASSRAAPPSGRKLLEEAKRLARDGNRAGAALLLESAGESGLGLLKVLGGNGTEGGRRRGRLRGCRIEA